MTTENSDGKPQHRPRHAERTGSKLPDRAATEITQLGLREMGLTHLQCGVKDDKLGAGWNDVVTLV